MPGVFGSSIRSTRDWPNNPCGRSVSIASSAMYGAMASKPGPTASSRYLQHADSKGRDDRAGGTDNHALTAGLRLSR